MCVLIMNVNYLVILNSALDNGRKKRGSNPCSAPLRFFSCSFILFFLSVIFISLPFFSWSSGYIIDMPRATSSVLMSCKWVLFNLPNWTAPSCQLVRVIKVLFWRLLNFLSAFPFSSDRLRFVSSRFSLKWLFLRQFCSVFGSFFIHFLSFFLSFFCPL